MWKIEWSGGGKAGGGGSGSGGCSVREGLCWWGWQRGLQCVGRWWGNWKLETRRRGNSKRVNACAILLEHAVARLCAAVCTRLSRVSQLPVSPVESFRAYWYFRYAMRVCYASAMGWPSWCETIVAHFPRSSTFYSQDIDTVESYVRWSVESLNFRSLELLIPTAKFKLAAQNCRGPFSEHAQAR